MFAYPIGRLGWKIAARLGLPLSFKVKITSDPETKYLIAESEDFLTKTGGYTFVCEGENTEELEANMREVLELIFEDLFASETYARHTTPVLSFA